jgi:hypothetical protein
MSYGRRTASTYTAQHSIDKRDIILASSGVRIQDRVLERSKPMPWTARRLSALLFMKYSFLIRIQ